MNIINTAKLPKDKPLQFEGKIPELKEYSGRYASLSKLEETLKEINIHPDMAVRLTQQANGFRSNAVHIVYDGEENKGKKDYNLAYLVGDDYYMSVGGSIRLL